MKAATGELNLTVITLIAIAAVIVTAIVTITPSKVGIVIVIVVCIIVAAVAATTIVISAAATILRSHCQRKGDQPEQGYETEFCPTGAIPAGAVTPGIPVLITFLLFIQLAIVRIRVVPVQRAKFKIAIGFLWLGAILLVGDFRAQALIQLVDRIGLVTALVAHCSSAVCLVLIYDEVAVVITIDTECLGLTHIFADEESRHLFRR